MNTKGLLFPKPKDKIKRHKDKQKSSKNEFCIMPPSNLYSTERKGNLKRHEVFFGRKNRQLSIKYGLIIFLTDEMHNMSDKGIHYNKEFDNQVKIIGQKAFMKYYHKSVEEFRKIFGKNYLD